jgi:hypothetical protein
MCFPRRCPQKCSAASSDHVTSLHTPKLTFA